MRAVRLITRDLGKFQKDLEADDKARIKAAEMSARVEAYRLHRILKAELRQGRAGGRRFAPKSIIARKLFNTKFRRRTARKPLSRMAVPVRYRTVHRNGNTLFQVGFVDPNRGQKLSKNWVYLAFLHQQGGTVDISEEQRKRLRERGKQLARMQDESARFFFLKSTTKSVRIPARPIIDPFWRANKAQASRNIEENFKRKMNGERI